MQDFSKEKCNIYVVFNICLHIKSLFVGAHINLYYARAWEMKEDKTNGADKADKTDRADKTNGANKANKADKANGADKTDKADKTNGVDKAD